MEDVTDVVFREIISESARPDVFFTEFTNADGLMSTGKHSVSHRLKYTKNQRPIVAQIWGNNPKNLCKATKMISDLGFDGLDINMGCPVKEVVKKDSGAGMIGNYDLAKEVIAAAQKGVKNLPVSVKTRLGKDKVIIREWAEFLLSQNLAALTIHARTAVQQSTGSADWDKIGEAVKLRNKIAPETVIVGNGDIKNYQEALKMHATYGVDGVMIGRGVFANPWVFEKTLQTQKRDKADYLKLLVKHLELYEKTWGENKNFQIMKKFFKMYVNNFNGASALRQKLMEAKNTSEVKQILNLL